MATAALRLVSPHPLCMPAGRPLAAQLPAGRLVELSGEQGTARVSVAASIIACAQREEETAVWIQPAGGPLFPPDLADAGVDVEALVVIHVPRHAGSHAPFKGAELLLRSGGFGAVVIDLRGLAVPTGVAWQGRLLSLAREHQARVLLLTDTPAHQASLGPVVALRIESKRVRHPRGGFVLEHRVLKNKSGLPLDLDAEPRRGPWGLS